MEKKFEVRPNTGALFAVKVKVNPLQPDYRGDLLINLSHYEIVDGQITVSLSGWKKPFTGGTFLSLQAQKPYSKDTSFKQGDGNEEIPF